MGLVSKVGKVDIEVYGPDEAVSLVDVVNDLYRGAFAGPPFNADEVVVAHQRSYYPGVVARPGFRLVIARLDGVAAGFGFGYLLPEGSQWWSRIIEPLDEAFTRETGRRTFAVIDYGVLPAYRGTGVGRTVHDVLLAGSGAERSTLSVRPTAVDTKAIYFHWGWRRVGHQLMDPPIPSPEFDILVLERMPRLLD